MLSGDPEAVTDSTTILQAASEYSVIVSPAVTGDRSIVGVPMLPGLEAGLDNAIAVISAISV